MCPDILGSVVSAVTLFFANAVKGATQGNIISNGIFLAGLCLCVCEFFKSITVLDLDLVLVIIIASM